MNNMRQIMLALSNYEATHGQFPPARVLDGEGRPMHSWRVLLLPYLEETTLYSSYNLSEPWDGPNNRLLQDRMPAVYRCLSSKHPKMTHYKLVTGPGTAFSDGVQINLNSVPDGPSNCAALVEDNSPVNWMEPSDLSLEQAVEVFSHRDVVHPVHVFDGLFSKRSIGTNVGMLDASIETLDPINDPTELRRLFGISNGAFEPNRLWLGGRTDYKYGAMIAMGIYFSLAWVPVYLLVGQGPRSKFTQSFRLEGPEDTGV